MDDRESLQALVELLPSKLHDEYISYSALSMESGFPGRKLVVFDVAADGKTPTNVEILTLGVMRMSAQAGPTIEVTSNLRPGVFTVGMVPHKFEDRSLFLHVPQKFELRWKGRRSPRDGVNFAPHYAVLMKTRSKPNSRTPGDTYCVRLNLFWEMFPDSQVGY